MKGPIDQNVEEMYPVLPSPPSFGSRRYIYIIDREREREYISGWIAIDVLPSVS
jgi:hypothetical protein